MAGLHEDGWEGYLLGEEHLTNAYTTENYDFLSPHNDLLPLTSQRGMGPPALYPHLC